MEEEEAPLVAENSETQTLTKKNHTRDVHILSSAFLLMFLAYGAVQNLESTINTEEDIGTISLGILYLSFMVFSFFASLVVRFLGTKNALVLETAGYWLFIAVNLKPTWYMTVSASLYLGFSTSIIWVAEGGTTSGTTLLYIVFLCNMTLGTILMCFLQKRDAKGEETLPDSSAYNKHLAEYTKYIIEPALGESSVGGAMAVYGAFDAICSLAMGRLASGLKSTTLIVCAGAFIQLCVTSGVLGILYPLLIVAALGIGDGIFNTQLNALLGKLFKHDMEGAFAQLKVWQCVSIAVVFFKAFS
ncbi:unnamed protein product [Camellia sinensis]